MNTTNASPYRVALRIKRRIADLGPPTVNGTQVIMVGT